MKKPISFLRPLSRTLPFTRGRTRRIDKIGVLTLLIGLFVWSPLANAEQKPLFAEIFLAREKKAELEKIRQALRDASVERVSAQFFQTGYPPTNIMIGSRVPADVARRVIDLAIQYNRGITHLLPQFRFFPNQIAIGTSAFDERVPVPIQPEDLEQLRNPNLSDIEFRTLYRNLTGEKQLPAQLR